MTLTPVAAGSPAGDAPAEEPEVLDAAPVRVRRRPDLLLWFASAWVLLLVVVAITVDWLPLADYGRSTGKVLVTPGWHHEFLGTDTFGRSELSRVAHGARVSMTVGIAASLVAMAIGVPLGLLAAHFRGVVEAIVDILANTVLSVPPLILLLVIAAAVHPRLWTVTAGLSLLVVPAFARLTKANALAQGGREYVLAARAMGAGSGRLLFREILPNAVPPVLSYAVLVTASLIVAEGSLSFLGLGIPPPYPTWGGMIAAGQDRLSTAPYLVMVPSAVMVLTVFSLNIVGDRLQARFNVREAKL